MAGLGSEDCMELTFSSIYSQCHAKNILSKGDHNVSDCCITNKLNWNVYFAFQPSQTSVFQMAQTLIQLYDIRY